METRNTWRLYDEVAREFDLARDRSGIENSYLDRLAERLSAGPARILDLGCGTGEPIARYFVDRGHRITGVDAAPGMLALARTRFPTHAWHKADMRTFALGTNFDAIIAWDSLFHLPPDDQRAVFGVFQAHCTPGGLLLFTGGDAAGESVGDLCGRPLFHASLDPAEYAALLDRHGFEILHHKVADPDCADHTVWLAQQRNPTDGGA